MLFRADLWQEIVKKTHSIISRSVIGPEDIYCFQARQCIVQLENLTGCGSGEVKGGSHPCSGVYLHGSIKRKVSQDKRSPIEGLRLTKLFFHWVSRGRGISYHKTRGL